MPGIDMLHVLGPSGPGVPDAVATARATLAGLGAGPLLALLDAAGNATGVAAPAAPLVTTDHPRPPDPVPMEVDR